MPPEVYGSPHTGKTDVPINPPKFTLFILHICILNNITATQLTPSYLRCVLILKKCFVGFFNTVAQLVKNKEEKQYISQSIPI